MGLLDNWKQDKEIRRLEEAARKTPSPNTLSALIKKCWEVGEKERAFLEVQAAREKYPESEKLSSLYSLIMREKRQPEMEALKKIIRDRPTPAAFAQLAEIYKDLEEEDTALKYCREAMEKFPNDDNPYLIMGELRLSRFYLDFLIKDGQMAIKNFEKACELNNKNYKSLLNLASIYLQIGAITKARQKLKNILLFAPEDDNIKEMLRICSEIEKPAHEDIDYLLQLAEEKRDLYYYLDKKKRIAEYIPQPENFNVPLAAFKNIEEIQCILICDADGNLIAHHTRENVDLNTHYEVASLICQTVHESSRQMDIGRFQKCYIEGPVGCMSIIASARVIYIAFAAPNVKGEQLDKHLQKLISTVSLQST